MPEDIDHLPVAKSHIDLSDPMLPSDFGMGDYVLSFLFDDVILVEFADMSVDEEGNEFVERNGIIIPVGQVQNAWRKGRVILVGPNVRHTKIGDIVTFPNKMGIPIKNLEVENHGKLKNGLFLNEQRMFGICKPKVDA